MREFSGPLQHVELSSTLWLIALMPALGALLCAALGSTLQRTKWGERLSHRLHIGSLSVTLVAVGALVAAFGLSISHSLKLAALPESERYLYCHLWQMVRVGSVDINFDLALDPLSSVMVLVITGVGSLIHVYAASYMAGDRSYWRFFTYLNLFVFSMLLLVLGDGFIVMFFGWEGVGLCSYLLIGFWYQDYKKATAGMKAFITNRVGDWGFLTGLLLLFWGLGGTWASGGLYERDILPRLAAVELRDHESAAAEHRTSSVSAVKHHPGAQTEARHLARGESEPLHHGGAPTEPQQHGRVETQPSGPSFVSMTAYPGAAVYLDDSPTPWAVSPFVKRIIAPGGHRLRVDLGADGQEQTTFTAGQGNETVVSVVGSTFVFRQLHDQLVMRNGSGNAELRAALMSKSVWGGVSLITLACLFLFLGATGKSAQIPLYVWLPDAMAGPTPVSALIHAATMVTAGVYMIARLSFLFALSSTACAVVAGIGALTALFAASIGLFQYDIKKVLAYSTISQLGFMFIGVGVGAYWAGVFHLVTHAFFKACLFLGSGSVIHGMHAVEHDADAAQDMRRMGGLKSRMPLTARTYQVACLAITAAPIPLFAGFWSKDEILWKALNTQNIGVVPGVLIYAVALVAAACTSFYMWRSYYLTFEGEHTNPAIADKVHDSPRMMTYVLAVLALLSTFAGVVLGFSTHLVGNHHARPPLFEGWLEPVLAAAEVHFRVRGLGAEYASMAVSVALAIGAFLLARRTYGPSRSPEWEARERALPLFSLIHNKYWVDEFYQATVIGWTLRLRHVLGDMDRWVVDGLVNGASVVGRVCAWVSGAIDHVVVDGVVNRIAEGTLHAGEEVRKIQTGRIQSYVYGLLGGVAFLFVVGYLLTK